MHRRLGNGCCLQDQRGHFLWVACLLAVQAVQVQVQRGLRLGVISDRTLGHHQGILRQETSAHRAGIDYGGLDTQLGQFGGQGLGQASDCELGGNVAAPARIAALEADDGGHVEHMPAALGAQVRQHVAQYMQRREHVDVEIAAQFGIAQRLDGALLTVAGVVDHAVDAAEGGDGLVDGGLDAGLIDQIHLQRKQPLAAVPKRLIQAGQRAGCGGHRIPAEQGLPRKRQADAARGAGDEPDFGRVCLLLHG